MGVYACIYLSKECMYVYIMYIYLTIYNYLPNYLRMMYTHEMVYLSIHV